MYVFLYIFILMWSVAFSLSRFLFELCNLFVGGPAYGTCVLPGSLGYFFRLGSRVAEWLPLGKANANGGPKCTTCLA
jgi:hypothetical protein